jgi:hypothetical protein
MNQNYLLSSIGAPETSPTWAFRRRYGTRIIPFLPQR